MKLSKRKMSKMYITPNFYFISLYIRVLGTFSVTIARMLILTQQSIELWNYHFSMSFNQEVTIYRRNQIRFNILSKRVTWWLSHYIGLVCGIEHDSDKSICDYQGSIIRRIKNVMLTSCNIERKNILIKLVLWICPNFQTSY